ncbi:amidohydrolase [candidate division KSB1 bacterium]|nr:amidohydrolase [candidate division KSB1 bacterium]NIR70471.1 amidohydrolase [candidate division KSB1 bacterium]NIS23201.1 amidohydrolase [candidate division KSB1 bacterium]NIT70061.1 amidohydrolase [candidate division KSB1 bacterium]NIU23698.1 amidohydrolase [candidate division KSB1 bacterium]
MPFYGCDDESMSIEEYEPRSTLVVPEHIVTHAKYPFVDVHSHQWRMDTRDLDSLIADMDSLNMAVMVNLSGRGLSLLTKPDERDRAAERKFLKGSVENINSNYPNRFVVFTNIGFANFGDPEWMQKTVKQIEEDVKLGAKGLKIYKNLGLTVEDQEGKRVPVDDARLDPIWAKCGELGIPVLIHSAEPAPFWEPKDKYNERWLELKQKPERYRDPDIYPPWEQIMNEQHNVFRKHPETTFINAHLGWMGNNLARLGELLDEIPNMYTEIGAVLAELGRQPRFARKWFIKYQDRVLFGKDLWRPEEYYVYFRVLETADEYFDYYRKRHAFWKMYGLDLPDEVLRKLYYKNALRIIPGLDRSLFPDS